MSWFGERREKRAGGGSANGAGNPKSHRQSTRRGALAQSLCPRTALACHFVILLALALASAGRTALAGEPAGAEGPVSAADGTWEDGVSWGPEGTSGPESGAFAQQLPVSGTIESIELRVWRVEATVGPGWTVDVFVWADAEGQPGPILAQTTLVYADFVPPAPEITTIEVPILAENTEYAWIGARFTPLDDPLDRLALVADLDGAGGPTAPLTHVAPGLGLPEGWQPLELVGFPPARALGSTAHMNQIHFVGEILESVGGSSESPAARGGVWGFDRFADGEYDAPACTYAWPDTFGSIVDDGGWILSADSDPAFGVGPIIDGSGDIIASDDSDVEGQVLWFYDPDTGGFPPGHTSIFESVVIEDAALGLSPGLCTLCFVANAEGAADPQVADLRWIVGSQAQRPDGTWGAWHDLTIPVSLDPEAYTVPLVSYGPSLRVRIGMTNPTDVLISHKGKAGDKVEVKKKAYGPSNGYKPVPVVKQKKNKFVCQSAAAASCLAYWAANGYPEILPGDANEDLAKRQQKLGEELAKHIEPKPRGKGRGWGGIEDYLKEKGVYKPDLPPGPPPRRPLVSEDINPKKGAPYDSLKAHLSRNHDVILGFNGYKVVNGDTMLVESQNHPGPVAHAVTAAEVNEEVAQGTMGDSLTKSTIRVADPNSKSNPEVTDKEKGKAYVELEVDLKDGKATVPVRVHNKDWEDEWGCDFFCLTTIQIVRPFPKNPPGERPSQVIAEDLLAPSGGDTLRTYGYALDSEPRPVSYFAVELDMPYYDVESPPGWYWEPLPSLPPGYDTCENAFGPAGIAWRTDTNPVPPGEYLGGFHFKVHERYEPYPRGVDWYTGSEEDGGTYGFVNGPALDSPSSDLEDDVTTTRTLLQAWTEPNPARGRTALHFATRLEGDVEIGIFDVTGRQVRGFEQRGVTPGAHAIEWNGTDTDGRRLPSGIYFYRLKQSGSAVEQRIVLLEPR